MKMLGLIPKFDISIYEGYCRIKFEEMQYVGGIDNKEVYERCGDIADGEIDVTMLLARAMSMEVDMYNFEFSNKPIVRLDIRGLKIGRGDWSVKSDILYYVGRNYGSTKPKLIDWDDSLIEEIGESLIDYYEHIDEVIGSHVSLDKEHLTKWLENCERFMQYRCLKSGIKIDNEYVYNRIKIENLECFYDTDKKILDELFKLVKGIVYNKTKGISKKEYNEFIFRIVRLTLDGINRAVSDENSGKRVTVKRLDKVKLNSCGVGCTNEVTVETCENLLGLTLSNEYRGFIRKFGYVRFGLGDKHQWYGITAEPGMNIVENTLLEKAKHPNLPDNTIVLEGNEERLILVKHKLKEEKATKKEKELDNGIYLYSDNKIERLCNSIEDYLKKITEEEGLVKE
jgi:hypothetical protein